MSTRRPDPLAQVSDFDIRLLKLFRSVVECGGFSAAELDFMHQSPLVLPVGLGPRILRAETAALAALAVWQAVAGDGTTRPPRRG